MPATFRITRSARPFPYVIMAHRNRTHSDPVKMIHISQKGYDIIFYRHSSRKLDKQGEFEDNIPGLKKIPEDVDAIRTIIMAHQLLTA
jgi:hypothetical protein